MTHSIPKLMASYHIEDLDRILNQIAEINRMPVPTQASILLLGALWLAMIAVMLLMIKFIK